MAELKNYCLSLVTQIKKGGREEETAMRELEKKLRQASFAFIRHRLSGVWEKMSGLDEDVFREGICILYKKIKDHDIDNIPGYFHIVLRNKCADIINRFGREETLDEELFSKIPDDNPNSDEIDLYITIKECITKWKRKMPRNWEIFELHFVQGFKFQEIADQLNKGLSATKVSSSRFIEKVRACIQE